MNPVVSLILALLIASPGHGRDDEMRARRDAAARCQVAAGHLASRGRLGAIRLGMPVAELLGLCPGGRRQRDYDAEAMPVEIVSLVPPSPAIRVTIERGRVERIDIQDPAVRDRYGNHPGRVLRRGVARAGLVGVEGDGNLYLYRAGSCGLVYLIDYEPGDREHRQTWRSRDIQALRPFRIREIGIHRC